MHACLRALRSAPRPTREALLLVSVRTVASVLAKVTLDWAHTDWNLCGLAATMGVRLLESECVELLAS